MIPHQTLVLTLLFATKVVADDTKLLNTVPFIMAHDAGSGYLIEEPYPDVKGLVKGWTKTQSGGLGQQLECGARAFDARPAVNDAGDLVWHHGGITVNHSFAESLSEVTSFCAENPAELVLMIIFDCAGDGCDQAVDAAFEAQGVAPVTSCSVFQNLTLAAAGTLAALPTGGQLLAVHSPAESSCSYSNYMPSVACSGVGEKEVGLASLPKYVAECLHLVASFNDENAKESPPLEAIMSMPFSAVSEDERLVVLACLSTHVESGAAAVTSGLVGGASASAVAKDKSSPLLPGVYRCYDQDPSSTFPLDRMGQYLDNTSTAFDVGPAAAASNGQLWQMQALWQESIASVVLGMCGF